MTLFRYIVSSQVKRRMLLTLFRHPGRAWGVRELAEVSGIDVGNAGRYKQEMLKHGIMVRAGNRNQFIGLNPDLPYLDLWLEIIKEEPCVESTRPSM